mmetsp:Transcript_48358/g.109686  ORF Transcript_48358/g.109686 Transcript_48358/m.109686 type:complete len:245 (-) Transcript_48358:2663-3397(-)
MRNSSGWGAVWRGSVSNRTRCPRGSRTRSGRCRGRCSGLASPCSSSVGIFWIRSLRRPPPRMSSVQACTFWSSLCPRQCCDPYSRLRACRILDLLPAARSRPRASRWPRSNRCSSNSCSSSRLRRSSSNCSSNSSSSCSRRLSPLRRAPTPRWTALGAPLRSLIFLSIRRRLSLFLRSTSGFPGPTTPPLRQWLLWRPVSRRPRIGRPCVVSTTTMGGVQMFSRALQGCTAGAKRLLRRSFAAV